MGAFRTGPLSLKREESCLLFTFRLYPLAQIRQGFFAIFSKNLRQAAVVPVNHHFFSQIADSLHQPGRLDRVIRVLGRAKVALQGLHVKVGAEEGRQVIVHPGLENHA